MLLESIWESATSLCMDYTLEIKERGKRAVPEGCKYLNCPELF